MGIFVIPGLGDKKVPVNGEPVPFGLITPRVEAVWVTPEQMQMVFRASNGNVIAQCKKSAFSMAIALTCSICQERHPLQAVSQINASNMISGPIKNFLDSHKHPIVEETVLPQGLPKAQTEPVTRRIKETV